MIDLRPEPAHVTTLKDLGFKVVDLRREDPDRIITFGCGCRDTVARVRQGRPTAHPCTKCARFRHECT